MSDDENEDQAARGLLVLGLAFVTAPTLLIALACFFIFFNGSTERDQSIATIMLALAAVEVVAFPFLWKLIKRRKIEQLAKRRAGADRQAH
jgi:uncharacterized membrane protein YqjE